MTRAVIVGDRGSGRTTFLGLLYAAQVKSGSDKEDDFRFHAAFDSLDEITSVFQQLMSGSFPDAAAKEGIHEMTFRLGYRKPRLGIWSRARSQGRDAEDSTSFRLILLRTLPNAARSSYEGSVGASVSLRDVLESDAFVIFVDAKNLAVPREDTPLGPMPEYDTAVESLLTTVQRSRTRGGPKLPQPIFVFSKFDAVHPAVLRHANLETAPPVPGKTARRAAYGRALLDPTLPKTMARLRAREGRGPDFATPSYFFSWVRTDEAPGRQAKVRLRHSGPVGWEPDYSREEYVGFLEYLWSMAPRAPR